MLFKCCKIKKNKNKNKYIYIFFFLLVPLFFLYFIYNIPMFNLPNSFELGRLLPEISKYELFCEISDFLPRFASVLVIVKFKQML